MRAPSVEDSFVATYRSTVGPLYAYVSRRTGGSVALAEDVTQETYLRAVAAWRDGPRPDEPLAWLRTVAKNLLVSHFRRRTPDAVDPAVFAEVLADVPVSSAPAAGLVHWALSHLPRRHAVLIEAFYLDGRSTREIAAEHGVTERAVEGRLHRARARLRARLEPCVGTPGDDR